MTLTWTIGGIAHVPVCPSFTIQRETGGRIATAQFSLTLDPAAHVVGTAKVGTAKVGSIPSPQSEVIVTNSDTGARVFGGYISKVTPNYINATQTKYDYDCQGYAVLLHRTLVAAESYASQSDQAIIQDLFTTYLPEVDTATYVDAVTTIALDIEGQTLAQIMDRICDLTGAEWTVDADKKLVYQLPSSNVAPWGFSENPDGVNTFNWDWQGAKFSKDFATPANYVTVIGSVSGSANITATAQDARSQRVLGRVFSKTIIDRNVTTATEATLRAQVEVARYAWPEESGSITYRKDGLDVGMQVPITAPSWGINGNYTIRRMRIHQATNDTTVYTIEFGSWLPETVRMIAELNRMAQRAAPAKVPKAVPADNSILAGHFAASIEPVGLVDAVPNVDGRLAIAKTENTVYNANDEKLYRWNTAVGMYVRKVGAGDLEADSVTAGIIAAGAIRAVDAVFDSGAIQSADIGNLQVKTANIDNLAVTEFKIGALAVTNAKIANATITEAKISTLSVGGGAGRPGKLTVYNGAGTAVGFFGVDGADEGGWVKTLSVGGTDYASGKLKADTDGDLTITDASVSITGPSDSTIHINSLNGLKIVDNTTAQKYAQVSQAAYFIYDLVGGVSLSAQLSSLGVAIFRGGNQHVALSVNNLGPVLNLYNPTTGEQCYLSARDGEEEIYLSKGKIKSVEGFKAGASDGITGTRTVKDGAGANKTVTITGGIITGWET